MKKLQVPDNISLRPELLHGIGWKEVFLSLAITSAALLLAVAVTLLMPGEQGPAAGVITAVTVLFLCFGFFARMENGQSICDYLRRIRAYHRSQQIYFYVRKEVLQYVPEE